MRRFLLILIFLAMPFSVSAYSEKTTHPALTDEIVDFFNLYYPPANFSDAEKELIKRGSIEEDNSPRWMHANSWSVASQPHALQVVL